MKLTPQEIELFRHNGFVKLPTQLPEEQVEALKAATWQGIRDEVEPVSRQDGRVIRLTNLWGRGGIFQETIVCDKILDPVESLLGPNIEFLLNRHNHVYLRDQGSKASLNLHRDVKQWSRTIVTVLIYLEDTHLENGCTRVVPGSHLLPAFSNRNDKDSMQIALSQAIPLPMPAGGLLAIDSMILHAAGKNQTDSTRMSMTLGYHSVDEFSGSDDPKKVLVRGEKIYGGNDHAKVERR